MTHAQSAPRRYHRASGALLALAAVLAIHRGPLPAQAGSFHPVPPPAAHATERRGAVAIDGRLDEAAWEAAAPITEFTQFDPHEGRPATQRTEVRFLYDADALYVGARMYDSLGARGVQTQLVRRDQSMDSDWFQVIFDTFHDHLGRAFFQVNPAGARQDMLAQSGGGLDPAWDPIWEVKARIDSVGWSAEMRIPLSQLRFSRDSVQTWGLQVRRFVQRLNEEQQWAFWHKTDAGGPAWFGHLDGLRIRGGSQRLEVLPYVVARSSFVRPASERDPFRSSSEYTGRAGADLKYLLTSNLTLDATVNPDFGQVEVDPAVVNLSAFETFFEEKRPFFIEGAGIFSFGGLSCYFCSNVSSLSLFYSRRVGRQPQGSASGAFVDVPENTTILGAAKITGRLRNGMSVGILNALTRAEHAAVMDTSAIGTFVRQPSVLVEPLSNYFVGRVKKDYRGGNLVLGGIGTSLVRRLDYPALARRLNRHAESGGADMLLTWSKQRYSFWTQFAVSSIAGDSNAVLRAQRSSARYFQRPDMDGGSRLDASRRSMQGYGGYARLAKESGDWLWEAQTNYRSPGFETNDLAFLTRADYVWMNANVVRQWTKPTRWYRSVWTNVGGQQQYNYDGDLIDRQLQAYYQMTMPNFWTWNGFYIYRPATLEDRLTRGGPVVMRPTNRNAFLNVSTDSRKRVVLGTETGYSWNDEGSFGYNAGLAVTVKPSSNVRVSLEPSFNRSSSTNGFVAAVATDTAGNPFTDPVARRFYGLHYVFANLVQRTLSMDTRLSVTFTPALTLELFAQPLIASAEYSDFKEFDAPRSLAKSVFGRDRGSIERFGTGWDTYYLISPDGAPASTFRVDPGYPLRDFNFRSLRGNAVLRWEYRPGSTLFVVWTQERDDLAPTGDLAFGRDRTALFGARPNNVFLVKMNYYLGF